MGENSKRCSRADDCSLPSLRDPDRADVLMDTFLRDPSSLSTVKSSESKHFFPVVLAFLCVICDSFDDEKSFYLISESLFYFFFFPIIEQDTVRLFFFIESGSYEI